MKFKNVFKSKATRASEALHRELERFPLNLELEEHNKAEKYLDLFPRIEELQKFIEQGADLNKSVKYFTAFAELTTNYVQCTGFTADTVGTSFRGKNITKDEWRGIEQHFVKVARFLIENGADIDAVDPSVKNKAAYYLERYPKEQIKPFADLIEEVTKKKFEDWLKQETIPALKKAIKVPGKMKLKSPSQA